MLSYIQHQILSFLIRTNEGLKYSEIMPENVDKDLFNYHLKFLLEKGYVEKKDSLYFLTDFGKKYVQHVDVRGDYKEYFKVSVLPYVVREIEGERELLLHKRLRHPYFGDVASVSGKVLHGEKIEDAASRKLKEETGLLCTNFVLIGVIRKMRKTVEDKLFEDTLYHVCYGENPTGELLSKTEFGENFWGSFEDALNYHNRNIVASKKSVEVVERIRDKNFEPFYFQEEITVPKV